MKIMNKELVKKVKDVAFLTGNFTTRAGKKTTYYIDKYLFETQPEVLDAITTALLSLLPPADSYDRLAAPELGGVALAAALSIKANKPFVIVRKGSKGYGTEKLIEGAINPNERIVLIEDVLTTAGAALKACDVLLNESCTIVDIIGVINREEGAMENIAAKGLTGKALITTSNLLAV
jgi:orotate phosphoribosyltransferase